MVRITHGETAAVSKNVPEYLTITNLSQDKQGSCQITGDGYAKNLQIPAGTGKREKINKNPVEVYNSGKADLEVPGGVVKATNFVGEINKVQYGGLETMSDIQT